MNSVLSIMRYSNLILEARPRGLGEQGNESIYFRGTMERNLKRREQGRIEGNLGEEGT